MSEPILLTEVVIKSEPCSGCGKWNQLVQRGKIWFQPDHNCDKIKEEELNVSI